jgi:diguanylate cyclase (GGDEF)-like protein
MMALDLQTLLVVVVVAAITAGGLLLLSWLYHRYVAALAFWGSGFLLAGAGTALIVARGSIPDLLSIMVGNALLALAYGVIWSGIRSFEGRRISIVGAVTGALLWLAACQIDAFYGDVTARVILMAAIISAYTILNVYELWNARDPAPTSRWPIIVLLVGHALIFLVRIPLAGSLPLPVTADHEHASWVSLIVLESVFTIFCLCYLLGSLARERIVMMYKRDALVDPLTGVINRRGFMERGERLLRRANADGKMVALLLFDLDHFKQINDRFGHHAGDDVLKNFCVIAVEAVRPADLFGRLGGEEFGCLLYHSSLRNGTQVAERVRTAVEAASIDLNGRPLQVTISAGVATTNGQDLESLMKAADLALYRAKAKGRNRVEPPPIPAVWHGHAAAS